MSGKTQTTTQQTQIPPEVLARYNSVNTTAQQAASTPYQQYSTDPNAFVAPINAQQTTGINATNQYANAAQPAISGGEALTLAGAGAVNPTALSSSAIQQYENPYTSYVTNQQSQLMNQQNQQAQAGQLGNAITSGAFGGDRSGIAAANLAGQQSLAYGNAMASTLQQGYNTALSTAQQQQGVGLAAGQANAARLTQAGAQLASLGQAGQTAGLAGAQAQTAAGTLEQQTTQAGDTALYNQFEQQQSYPFQTAQFLANIAEGTGAQSGQTTSTTSPAPFFSDRRLKENIKKIGAAKNGLPIYSFNYKGDPEKITRLGFMADEVEKKHPDAVGLAGGFKTVDYDAAARPKRYAGGLITDSDEGRGFDAGGAANPTDWASMLASHQGMYGTQASGPSSGAGAAGSIPGGGKSYVPASIPSQHQMLQPAKAPAPQPSAVAQLAQLGQQVGSLEHVGAGLKDAYADAKKGLAAAAPSAVAPSAVAPSAVAPAVVQPPTPDPNAAAPAGGLYARGGLAGGLASGGDPEGLYQSSDGLNIPNENPQYHLPQAGTPGSAAGQSGLSQIAGLAGTASGLGSLGSSASSGMGSLLTSLGPMFTLKDGGVAKDAGLAGENFDFARGGLAAGGLPSDDDAIAAQDALDSAGQFSGGLDPKADLEAARHLQSDAPALSVEEPHKAEGLIGLRAAKKDLAEQGYFDPQVNPERTNFGGLPNKLPDGHPTAPVTSGLNAADLAASVSDLGTPATSEATPDVPLPPPRPADLGLQQVADAEPAPRPGLAPQAEPNPVVRAGNAASAGLTGAVEGVGHAVGDAFHNAVKTFESGNQNVYNTNQSTSSGRAGGYYQITSGTWKDFAPNVPGASQYADAAHAPESVQKAVADTIPLGRWDPITLRKLEAAGFNLDPRRTLAENARMNGDRNMQASTAPDRSGGVGNAAPSGLAGMGASVDGVGRSVTDAGQKAGGWFGDNESWLVPLLSGVGAMASSNSRYLGSALLQGLGGGAQAYAQEQASLANRGQTQAGTAGTQAETARRYQEISQHGFFLDPYGVARVQLQNGDFMLKSDWDAANAKGTAPKVVGQDKLTASLAPGVSGSGNPARYGANPAVAAGVATPSAPAAPLAPVAPPAPGVSPPAPGAFAGQKPAPLAPAAPLPTGVTVGDSTLKTALSRPNPIEVEKSGRPGFAAHTEEYADGVRKEANAAEQAMPQAQKSMETVNDLVHGSGLGTAGAGGDKRAAFLNFLNTSFAALGSGRRFSGTDSADQINQSIQEQRNLAMTSAAGQHSLGALDRLSTAVPTMSMPPDAMATVEAQIVAAQRRSIDRGQYLQHLQDRGVKNLSAFEDDFNTDNGQNFNIEVGNLKRIIQETPPELMKHINSGKMSAQELEDNFQKKMHLPPGMSRFFTNS